MMLNKFRAVLIALSFTNFSKIVHIMIMRRLSYTTELEIQNELWFLIRFYYMFN